MTATVNPVDAHVGARLNQIRMVRGFSQERVARALGITFQQIQKYEKGTNRITAGRLFDLAVLLDVPVGDFYEQMPDHVAAASPAAQAGTPMDGEPPQSDPLSRRENLEVVRHYIAIQDPNVRARLYRLIRQLANAESNDDDRTLVSPREAPEAHAPARHQATSPEETETD